MPSPHSPGDASSSAVRALLPGLTDGLERWVPDVRVELLSGAGHWTPQECPAEVSRLIREFVDSG